MRTSISEPGSTGASECTARPPRLMSWVCRAAVPRCAVRISIGTSSGCRMNCLMPETSSCSAAVVDGGRPTICTTRSEAPHCQWLYRLRPLDGRNRTWDSRQIHALPGSREKKRPRGASGWCVGAKRLLALRGAAAEVVLLADLDAAVAQQRVGGV